jgi:uncharacterized protein (DUF433 family)
MNPIWIDPERMGGKPCFNGTRVPVSILFDLLSKGISVDEFLEDFPSVEREQVTAVLKMACECLTRVEVPV